MVDMNIIYRKIDSFRDEIIEMQRELTARPALGPLNGERESTTRLILRKSGLQL